MKKLDYSILQAQNLKKNMEERFLQIGEGNFLRAFVDYFIDVANEKIDLNSKVVVVQPIENGLSDILNEQEGLYTLYLRGLQNNKKVEEKRIISCISRAINPYTEFNSFLECAKNPNLRFIISNTTEAGITFDQNCKFDDKPPITFPAKLTRFLYERYTTYGLEKDKGFIILPCELIDNNGEKLKECIIKYIELWNLDNKFYNWVIKENIFCSTLVDRIVTGYPRLELDKLNIENGYEDKLLNTCENFGFWVIEGPENIKKELPFEEAGLPVKIVNNHKPYKQRKVRILNGVHTAIVSVAYLSGKDTVLECMEDPTIKNFIDKLIYNEIIPTLTLPKEELISFANSVEDRFKNPFIVHNLLSISLNFTSKWKTRVLPSVKAYLEKNNELPECLVFSFAAYLKFFRSVRLDQKGLYGLRENKEYLISDDRDILEYFYNLRNADNFTLTSEVSKQENFWGEDLSKIPNFIENVVLKLNNIDKVGMYNALKEVTTL